MHVYNSVDYAHDYSMHWPYHHIELMSLLVHPNNAHFITRGRVILKTKNLYAHAYQSMGWLRLWLGWIQWNVFTLSVISFFFIMFSI